MSFVISQIAQINILPAWNNGQCVMHGGYIEYKTNWPVKEYSVDSQPAKLNKRFKVNLINLLNSVIRNLKTLKVQQCFGWGCKFAPFFPHNSGNIGFSYPACCQMQDIQDI